MNAVNDGSIQWLAYGEGSFWAGLEGNILAQSHALNTHLQMSEDDYSSVSKNIWKNMRLPSFQPGYLTNLTAGEAVTAACCWSGIWLLGTNRGLIISGSSLESNFTVVKGRDEGLVHKIAGCYENAFLCVAATDTGVFFSTGSSSSFIPAEGATEKSFVDIAFGRKSPECIVLASDGTAVHIVVDKSSYQCLVTVLPPPAGVIGGNAIVAGRKKQWFAALQTQNDQTQLAVIYPRRHRDSPYYDIVFCAEKKLPSYSVLTHYMAPLPEGFVMIMKDGSVYYHLEKGDYDQFFSVNKASFSLSIDPLYSFFSYDDNKILHIPMGASFYNSAAIMYLANVLSLA
jgi:hypothetical protein